MIRFRVFPVLLVVVVQVCQLFSASGQVPTFSGATDPIEITKLAKKGNSAAQTDLGVIHFQKGEFEAALEWFRRAAEQNYAEAESKIGFCYSNAKGVVKDDAESVRWYRRASEHGLAKAQHNLGLCYFKGKGVAKDLTEATVWFRKAAEQHYAPAQSNLGACYQGGEGVEKDPVKAVQW